MKRYSRAAAFGLGILMLACSSISSAATWRVEKDGSGDFSVIQDAVDAAASGDTIRIGPGRYLEYQTDIYGANGPVDIYVKLTKQELTLIGAGPDDTIVGPVESYDFAQQDRYGVIASPYFGSEKATVEGMRIVNQKFGIGGLPAADVITRNCRIDSCYHGVYVYDADSMILEECEFNGVVMNGDCATANLVSSVHIESCSFASNLDGIPNRVLLQCQSVPDARIENCSFQGDTAHLFFSSANGTVRDCRFDGPASASVIMSGAVAEIENCSFTGHQTGIDVRSGQIVIAGSTFSDMQTLSIRSAIVDSLRINDCVLDHGNSFAVSVGNSYRLGKSSIDVLRHYDLSRNDWGTASADSIAGRIYTNFPLSFVADSFPYVGQPGSISTISGQALLVGQSDHAGITVSAGVNGRSIVGAYAVTAADGSFALTDLCAGTYTVRANKEDWSTQIQEITLADGEAVTDLSLAMSPTIELEARTLPNLSLVDGGTVRDTQTVATSGSVSDVVVYLRSWHTNHEDLVVSVVSPGGTEVELHRGTGDLYGRYPISLTPYGDLDDLAGDPLNGDWTLVCTDQTADGDIGMLEQWRLYIDYTPGPVAVENLPIVVTPGHGVMALTWEVGPAGVDGYHVYRRTANADYRRLNDRLMPVGDGRLSFVDEGVGLTDGDSVFYTYTLVHGGVEGGYAPATEAVFYSDLPAMFALRGNHPNPFNPSTIIGFDLPRATHVRVDVFDVAGRLVKTLLDENRPAGACSVPWDGTDERGYRVAAGVYSYRVATDTDIATDQMMLVK